MSFVNPLFLIGLAAAALPVLYHLVRRMRAKQVPFSSLMLLKATPKEYVRRRRLRDLLLMAVRAALFAALALAFARPFIPEERLPFIAEREDRSVVLLLDASYSMQYADRFEEAKAAALERLNEAEGADEFAVIAFSNRPQQLTAFDAEGATHRSVVAGLDVTNRTTDVHAALQRAEEVLGEARHADRRIVLVSDFQQAGWSGPFENWKLAPGIAFEPVEVGGEAAGNAYVEAFNLTKRRTGAQTAVRFDARVAAQGEAAEAQRDVRLVVDGAEVDAQTVVPEASGRVSFELLAPREDATYGGVLALAEDALPVDDRFYFAYEVAPRPDMLVLDGGRGARRDAFFLQSAFATGDDARYAFRAATPDRLQSELQGQDVVFLTNAAGLTGAQTEAARRYVEEGGSVVVSFGERVDLGAFSGLLAALGVGAVERVVTPRLDQGADAIIGEVDGRHPVFSAFAGAGAGAIFRPTFRRYARLRPDSAATVWAATTPATRSSSSGGWGGGTSSPTPRPSTRTGPTSPSTRATSRSSTAWPPTPRAARKRGGSSPSARRCPSRGGPARPSTSGRPATGSSRSPSARTAPGCSRRPRRRGRTSRRRAAARLPSPSTSTGPSPT